ncbi:DUF4445 domain-containing protein [Candidatus Fermentibacteria bacterium]|nr:DUF4445 domain-containing protein [Candidatus Fermentibacteria bacterium]
MLDDPLIIQIPPGVPPLAAVQARLAVAGACGGRGRCGTCAVTLVGERLPPPLPADRRWIDTAGLARGQRLACTLHPGEYLVSGARTPATVTGHAWDRIISRDFVPGPAGPGIAIDIGTTTVMATAFDKGGMPGRVWSAPNLQRRYGADVMSRVSASAEPEGVCDLRRAVLEPMAAVVRAAAVSIERPAWIVAVGNTVMQHLVAGIDATSLGISPFAPREQGLGWHSVCVPVDTDGTGWQVSLVPPLGGLVGSDVVASIALIRKRAVEDPWLLVDMGTNCEMALWAHDRLLFTSVPAGPAFEGGGLSCGCVAGDGAVEHVEAKGDALGLTVIGGGAPVGLCGSAAIDLCAVLGSSGRMEQSGRLVEDPCVQLALPGLSFTQRDVREMQKAKAAVEIGVRALLTHASLPLKDLRSLVLCGAFARGLQLDNAQAIGLIPRMDRGRIMVAGNGALLGAGLCQDPGMVANLQRRGQRVILQTEGFAARFAEAVRLRPWE